MDNFNIIMFVCNWGPHAAFQALQDAGSDIPPQVRMVRIPCTGRITKSLLFKAFGDGCGRSGLGRLRTRFPAGTAPARPAPSSTSMTPRGILELLGLNQTRLRWATFLPEQSSALLGFLQDFQQDLRAIGRNPVHLAAKADVPAAGAGARVRVRDSCGRRLSVGEKRFDPAVDGVPRRLCVPGLREMLLRLSAHPLR